ncbi:MAG TPA: NADP-dependent isocitrate dehydrogenase [Arenimonas sp.]|uniref:NADP-dependent isocitrate dehydrogenase n=1 Tax=Arenimonas sp. TaxID=1872635 RepID=UPI002D7EA028|nr:NADP-dependent isocitrate dehydrogenase [Arenimonas sp.]HEU0152778.1 NADP-dependent isocitrate dehydrogenase [Arenimonas sp.]
MSAAAGNRLPATLPARTIAVAHGDGIGPEIMAATLRVLAAADPALTFHEVSLGLKAYEAGHAGGFDGDALDVIASHGVLLKAPLSTPQGGGFKSVNVTLRKTLGLFANVRPCVAYHPALPAPHPGMDLVVVRENEEDTYAGIEHRQTDEVVQCLKLITRPGCERIVRHAFEYAVANGRRKVTCMTKDNIMKLTDGLFHAVFEEIAPEYPGIATEHMIIDIGTARVATRPRDFDVIVTPNLYGDILSDVAAEVAGSIGLAPSANIGYGAAMFEAVHGSAPDIAGKDLANPSGLLLSAVMMLVHLGRGAPATLVHNAWLRTLEDGVLTGDVAAAGQVRRVGTQAFADAVIERLGQAPTRLRAVDYPSRTETTAAAPARTLSVARRPAADKQLEGVDLFLHWDQDGRSPAALGARLERIAGPDFSLELITNRGVKVYPNGNARTLCSDHWRCRFRAPAGVSPLAIAALMARAAHAGLDVIKTENLYRFDGKAGYSQAQGA